MLYLFGSRATGDARPNSDWDVFIDSACCDDDTVRLYCDTLKPFAVENGGPLDLFELAGDTMLAVFDEYDCRRVLLDKYSFRALQEDAEAITLKELIRRMCEGRYHGYVH